MNILVHTSLGTCGSVSVGRMPGSRIAGSKAVCIFNFERCCRLALHGGGPSCMATSCSWACFLIALPTELCFAWIERFSNLFGHGTCEGASWGIAWPLSPSPLPYPSQSGYMLGEANPQWGLNGLQPAKISSWWLRPMHISFILDIFMRHYGAHNNCWWLFSLDLLAHQNCWLSQVRR